MVRSRSETNLNRIFIDLCTSPQARRKYKHERNDQQQHHSPLPTLKPIKSNSCSNIKELQPNSIASPSSSSSESVQDEQNDVLHRTTIEPTSIAQQQEIVEPQGSTTTLLVPMQSTGFSIQTTTRHSSPLFETSTIRNHTVKSSFSQESAKDSTTKSSSLQWHSSTASGDLKHQDFLNRLQNRLKSRKHLRKYFLS
ncbi:unnamed protein product [Rotaria socialis]|uniref:Uncharacterized protein n=1 Tax=Rotaria socialis TaxID=392032 RepID=A0A820LPP1_9BILA|nr:unnamed protein product [Rotaria socialis]